MIKEKQIFQNKGNQRWYKEGEAVMFQLKVGDKMIHTTGLVAFDKQGPHVMFGTDRLDAERLDIVS